jgi:hypothetical protein
MIACAGVTRVKRLPESAHPTFCIFLAVWIALLPTSGGSQARKSAPELAVAAAADLSTALKEIGDGFQKKTGVTVKLSFGAQRNSLWPSTGKHSG